MGELVRVLRLDGRPLTKAQFTPEGYLDDRPILTSVGIFEYANPDGSVRRELRIPEEVFAPESLASYKGKPIIVSHDAGLIDKDNVSENAIGTILTEGYRDGDDVRAEIFIHNTDEMKASGWKELSLGYNLDLDETPGEYNGQKYDAIQRNIRINHLALVENARAGEQARLNIDSRDKKSTGGNKQMAKPKKSSRADGVLSPEELTKAIEEFKAKYHGQADAEEEKKEEPVVKTSPAPDAAGEPKAEPAKHTAPAAAPAAAPAKEEKPGSLEEQVEAVKSRHEDDEDVKLLCDIIDTLLAQKAFDSDDMEEKEENEDDADELETLKGDSDDGVMPADNEFVEQNEDEDDTLDTENEDGAGCEDENCDGQDDDTQPGQNTDLKQLNTDSIDEIVRARIKVGMIGRKLNMDGLEDLPLASAKKRIIKAVRPNVRLDGKSAAYINAMYDCAIDDINSRSDNSAREQKASLFKKDSADVKRESAKLNSTAARERMVARASKKNKED